MKYGQLCCFKNNQLDPFCVGLFEREQSADNAIFYKMIGNPTIFCFCRELNALEIIEIANNNSSVKDGIFEFELKGRL